MKYIIKVITLISLIISMSCSDHPLVIQRSNWNNYETLEAKSLTKTNVSGDIHSVIEDGKNQIYCVTYSLVFNEVKKTFPSFQITKDEDKELAFLTNNFKENNILNPSSYFSRAIISNKENIDKLNNDLKGKFPNANSVQPDESDLIFAYAYFDKKLLWEVAFYGNLETRFGEKGKLVECFGFLRFLENDSWFKKMANQVTIYYIDENNEEAIFVLHPTGNSDDIIIGMVKSKETLLRTYNYIVEKMKMNKKEYKFGTNSSLIIPKINFNIKDEIPRNSDIIVSINNIGNNLPLSCIVRLGLNLDERGATVVSDASVSIKSMSYVNIIVDKPFLIAFKENGSELPYTMAWIANSELLIEKNE